MDFSSKEHCSCLEFNKLGVVLTYKEGVYQIAIALPFLIFCCLTFDTVKNLPGVKYGVTLARQLTIYYGSKYWTIDLIDTLFGKETFTISTTQKFEILTHYDLGCHKTPIQVEMYRVKYKRWVKIKMQKFWKITLVNPYITPQGDILDEFTFGAKDLSTALNQLKHYFESL